MRRLTKSRTEGDAVRACSPPQGSPQGRVPDFVKRMLDDVLFDTQLRWVEKSGQAPHWTTFVLDAGDPTVNVGSADKTPPKVECRPTPGVFASRRIKGRISNKNRPAVAQIRLLNAVPGS